MKRVIRASVQREDYNPRSPEYYQYLHNHIRGVQDAWDMLKPQIETISPYSDYIEKVDRNIVDHDASKYSTAEFNAYCDKFYPCEGHAADKTAFDYAWSHHQHNNPHHWQYWVLLNDDGTTRQLDMPIEYILEMVCDWHSFSGRDPESTADVWYAQESSKMRLSDKTREFVEDLLQYLTEPVPAWEDE